MNIIQKPEMNYHILVYLTNLLLIYIWFQCLFRSSDHFWLGGLFFRYKAVWDICIFWRWIPCRSLYYKNFLPFCGLSFLFFMVFFAVQKLLCLIRSHLFIFVFISIALWGESKKVFPWFISKCILPMFFPKSFIVSNLTFRSLIYFEFIFVHGVRESSNFIILPVALLFSQCHLKCCFFSIVWSCILSNWP